ncbi:MAG: SUMF1/EgtB/PvdO family nonheme iron enzyme, partial [Anaerolineales bacterium]|nr:SUMF1/EgtB/PvdO family nonheme iron enzyme [Anaerolineales bacterium]
FADYNIALLDEEKIEKFAQEWYGVQRELQKVNEEEAQEKAQDLARRAVREIPNEMSGNPMMLTCIAIIHKSGRVFPKHRAVLFNEIVDILSSKWQEEKAGAIADVELAEVLKDKKLLRKALEGLAYKTHRSNYEAGGNTEEADLSYDKAYGLLREPEYFGSGKLAGAFLDYIYQQSGLFHSHGGEQTTYRFPHRQIQEYLAGCYLIGQDNCEELYKAHAAQGDFWSASALLGAEEIIYIQDKAERILLNIMYELCPSQTPKTEGTERAVLWAGQIAVQFGIDKIEQKARGKDYLKDLTSHTLYLLEKSQFISPRERAEAGNTLSQLDDPRFDSETWYLPKESLFGFVRIPAGEFLMGTKQEDIKELMEKFGGEEDFYKPETPQHTLHLPDFYTSRYPVTASQFRTFVEDSAYKPDDEDSLKGVLNHPVRYVTWYDAIAYCQWLNKRLQEKAKQVEVKHEAEEKFWKGIKSGELIVTLPSEAEWEKSASSAPPLSKGEGLGVRVFSWGNDFDKEKANVAMNIGNTSPVGCFPNGKSFYDLQDTTGNVWEWTRSMYKPYKYNSKDGRENMDDKDSPRVLRGGSFDDNDWFVRCAGRDWSSPNYRYYYVGFRAVVSHFS